MPENKVDLQIGKEQAEQALDALINKAKQLTAELQKAGNTLGASPSSQNAATFFSTAQQLSTVNSAISAIESSTGVGGVAAAAAAGSAPFARPIQSRAVSDPGAILNLLQSAGISGPGLGTAVGYLSEGKIPVAPGSTFDPAAYVRSVLTSSYGGILGTQPSGPYSSIGPPGMQMNSWLLKNHLTPEQLKANPFAGMSEPGGPFSVVGPRGPGGVSWNQFVYEEEQRQNQAVQMSLLRGAAGYAAVSGVSHTLGAYTSSVTSGQPQPMAFGQAYGGISGFAAGAGIGFLVGGVPGAIVGGMIGQTIGGPIINALQAPFIAREQAALSVLPVAAASGKDSGWVMQNLLPQYARIANGLNAQNGLWGALGLSTDTQQTSLQDIARIHSSLSGALFNRGDASNGESLLMTARLVNRFGLAAPQVAQQIAPMVGDVDAYSDADKLLKYGPLNFSYYQMAQGRPDTDYRSAYGGYMLAARSARVTGQEIAASQADLSASPYAGLAPSQMGGYYAGLDARLIRQGVNLNTQLSNLVQMPGGANSEAAATVRAQQAQLTQQRASLKNQQSTGLVGQTYTEAATRQAQLGASLTSAQVFGTPEQVQGVYSQIGASLVRQQQDLAHQLSLPGLTWQQRQGIQQDLASLERQQIQTLNESAGVHLGSIYTRAATSQAAAGTAMTTAQLLGRAGDVGTAAAGLMATYSTERGQLTQALNTPGLTWQQRQGISQDISRLDASRVELAVSTRDELYRRSDVSNYDIPSMRNLGALTRAQYLPYSPSNIYALSGRQIGLNMRQIGVLQGRMQSLRASGMLTEDLEANLTGRIQSLYTQDAQMIATLSEGRENLVAPLLAGRRRAIGAVDSFQLAALSYARIGSPIRSYGAVNGQQMAYQNAFAASVGLSPAEQGPYDRMGSYNSLGGGTRTDALLSQIVQLLSQMARGSSQGQRVGMPYNNRTGQPTGNAINQGNLSIGRGN